MKYIYTILTTFLFSKAVFSQVAVGTDNPQGIFNIDGAKDNPKTGSGHTDAQQLNDFTVTTAGNVGIGLIAPSKKLDIKTAGTTASPVDGFKLVDGTQSDGKVLVTDDNGSAHWQYPTLTTFNGTIGAGKDIYLNNPDYEFNYWNFGVGFYQSGSSITLPRGTFQVNVNILIAYKNENPGSLLTNNDWFWTRTTLSDDGTSNPAPPTADLVGTSLWASNIFNGPGSGSTATDDKKFQMIKGSLIVKNSSGGNKTYYLLVGALTKSASNLPGKLLTLGGYWGENTLTAIQIQ